MSWLLCVSLVRFWCFSDVGKSVRRLLGEGPALLHVLYSGALCLSLPQNYSTSIYRLCDADSVKSGIESWGPLSSWKLRRQKRRWWSVCQATTLPKREQMSLVM